MIAEINHADRDVQHVQARKAKERAAEKRHCRIEVVRPRRDFLMKQRHPFRGVNANEEEAANHGDNQVARRFLASPLNAAFTPSTIVKLLESSTNVINDDFAMAGQISNGRGQFGVASRTYA